jgi:sulfatase modifying factor 1
VVDVSWDDATAYAEWAGCELASEAQWERAARGPLNRIYPWADEWDQARCRNANNRGSGQTCAVHGYPEGVSGYGTYNQSGNLWEWCGDWYGEGYYGQSPTHDPRGPEGGSYRVFRGGSWWDGAPAGFRGAGRGGDDPGGRGGARGFRLVRPASRSLPS